MLAASKNQAKVCSEGREKDIYPPSKKEELRHIGQSMSIVLDTNKLKALTVSYYVHYDDTLLQNATDIITEYSNYFIKKWDKGFLQNASSILLQNATVFTKCYLYYKLRLYSG